MGAYDQALPLYQRALKICEKALGPEHPDTATSLNNLALLYQNMGAYEKALPLFQRALKITEKALGPEHPDTAVCLNNLALLYQAMGIYEKALPLSQRALQIKEKALGPEHPTTATSLNNLARLYHAMGIYEKALPLYQRTLKIKEKALGPEHPDTAVSLNNLAELYKDMGAYEKALPLYQRALKICEKALGPEHPDTASSLNNLAGLYQDMGAYEKALPLYQRALKIFEKRLGPEHPDTASSLNNLAALYDSMGAYDQALPLHQRALKICEKALGPEHPSTATSLSSLALLYEDMGAYEKALPLFQRALKITEKASGPEHPSTATSLNNLGGLYEATGAYEKALPLFQRALQIREKALGPEHPVTATSLNNLAALYKDMGAYEKALPLYQRALQISEKALGPEHPSTAGSLNNLAILYEDMGAYEKALPLFQRALKITEKALGPEHPSTATSLNNLAGLYKEMGAYEKALLLYQRALKIFEKAQGPEHPSTATSLNNLAILYEDMGAYEKALPLFQRALQIREKALGPEHPSTATSLNNLAALYKEMGAYEKALPLYQQALKIFEKAQGPEHPSTATSLSNLGVLYLAQRNYAAAETYFRRGKSTIGLVDLALARGQPEEALKLLQDQAPTWRDTPRYQVQYYTLQGLALAGVGRRGEAALTLLKAVHGVEDLRRRTPGERAGFFQGGLWGGNIRPYRGLVSVLGEMAIKPEALPPALKEYGPEAGAAAFYFAEATKGRALLESMAQAARQTTAAQLSPELRQREEALGNRLAALESQWEKALKGGEAAVKEVKAKKEHLTGELHKLVQELRQQYPRYAALHYPQPLKPGEIPLRKGEVLLEFALGDKESFLFRVEPGGRTQVFRLALGQEALEKRLAPLLAPFRQDKLTRGDLQRFSPQAAAGLYQELLAPALKGVEPGTHLILVPDGVLGAFPLEALVVEAGKGWGDSVLVADKWPMTYAQSAAILALNQVLGPSQAGRPLFALGDCLYNQDSARYLAFKAGKGKAGELVLAAPEKPFTMAATRVEWGELYFRPLPQTRQMVTQLAALFNTEPRPPLVLLDVLATETRVLQAPLNQCRYLFFGTHGFLANQMSGVQQPVLVLTQVKDQPPGDGFLTLTKVLEKLKLDADLVTLAACMTGVGQVMQGEGVLNFARAFQQVGARSVMVALWNIPVKESLLFYRTFYQALKDGKSKLTALQVARQAVRSQKSHPFYWAGLILHGEG